MFRLLIALLLAASVAFANNNFMGASFCANSGAYVVPSDCLPHPKTTQAQCTTIYQLWASKFNYCCPYWEDEQVAKDDPEASAPIPSTFGSNNVFPVKWVGLGGGCKVFWDWCVSCSRRTPGGGCARTDTRVLAARRSRPRPRATPWARNAAGRNTPAWSWCRS
jgi:hypothetical protein